MELPKKAGCLPTFLPSFGEGETLYSLCARYHVLSGNVMATTSCQELFSHKYAGLIPDFPYHLDDFCNNTDELLGDLRTIAYERTLFGYYAPFQDNASVQDVFAQMRGSSASRLKSVLGLLPSRVGARHLLKACRRCVAEDLRRYQVARWRIEHQWPSVWVCPQHGNVLQMVSPKIMPRSLRRWILPDSVGAADWSDTIDLSRAAIAKAMKVATFSYAVKSWRQKSLDSVTLRRTYRLAAQRHGWLSTDGSLRFSSFKKSFADHYSGLLRLPGFDQAAGAQKVHGGLLGTLTRKYEGKRHPLKHFLLMAFLFSDPNDFRSTYEEALELGETDVDRSCGPRSDRAWIDELRHFVVNEHLSVSAAARRLHVPICVAVRYAKANGVPYIRRDRVLTPELESRLRSLASSGYLQKEIGETLGIKKGFVRSYLARNPDLREQWRHARQR
jgi:hypothetical protein